MSILFPRTTQYGDIDKAALRLATLLRDHAPKVWASGLSFITRNYGNNLTVYDDVTGPNFSIHFGRPQGLAPGGGHWNDCGALSKVTLGRASVSLYQDFSGPSFLIHVGSNWASEKTNWLKYAWCVNTKLSKKPKFALRYQAQDERHAQIWYAHGRRLSTYLVNDNDLGREYDAEPAKGEIVAFHTRKVLDKFAVVLNRLCELIEAGEPASKLSVEFPFDDGMQLFKEAAFDDNKETAPTKEAVFNRVFPRNDCR